VKRLAFGAAVAASALLATASPSAAAKPAVQACLGRDISGFATNYGSGFADFVVSMTTFGAPGVAEGLHAHMSGHLPDSVVPNSCNG